MPYPVGQSDFERAAVDYSLHRPRYPEELLAWVMAEAQLSAGDPVADIGCGTGIATRLLANRGLNVVGVEPNRAMREEAVTASLTAPHYRVVEGSASATTLEGASVKLVVAAEAFHWFDVASACAEARRILMKGGAYGVLCNLWADTPLMNACDTVLSAWLPSHRARPRVRQSLIQVAELPHVAPMTHASFVFAHQHDRAGFLGRMRSISHLANAGPQKPAILEALERVFEEHASEERVTMTYASSGWIWRFRE